MLLYLWIKDYKNIQSQGFSFDPRLEAVYNPEKGILTLNYDSDKGIVEKFFGENITHVTGVLGENGAGKSTLLDAIKETAGSFTNGGSYDAHACLFIFGNTIVHEVSVPVSNSEELIQAGYRLHEYNQSISFNQLNEPNLLNKQTGQISKDPITKHQYVYYSNFWDDVWMEQPPGVVDVSTVYLFRNIYSRNFKLRDEKYDSLASYRTQDFISEIRLLDYLRKTDNEKPLNIPFTLPRIIGIQTKEAREIYGAILDNDFFKSQKSKTLRHWTQSLEIWSSSATQEEEIEEFITRLIAPRILLLVREYVKEFSKFSPEELNSITKLHLPPPITATKALNSSLSNLFKFANFLREQYRAGHITTAPQRKKHGQGLEVLRLKLNSAVISQEVLIEIFTLIADTPNGANTFNISWHGLSSGQSAYLKLYARLHKSLLELKRRSEDVYPILESVTLLIDEGETGFHPQWQKQYMKLLLDIAEQLFQEYQVQIIVGSNSPFIASDLPKQNLLLLHRRAADGLCEIKPWGGEEETFAANIHTLLTDAFFMSGGLMGEFAKKKVTALIQYLQEEAVPSDDKREEMRAILEIIGEPVIRLKMREMWNTKFGLQERLADLQQQMRNIEEQIRRNG